MSTTGLHILGDLTDCLLDNFVREEGEVVSLREHISGVILEAGLRELGSYYHFFGPGAVTATICLAESHLTFHTWPEEGYVTIDVFVCNYNEDNSTAAREVFEKLVRGVFKSDSVKKTEILRHR